MVICHTASGTGPFGEVLISVMAKTPTCLSPRPAHLSAGAAVGVEDNGQRLGVTMGCDYLERTWLV